MPGSIIAPVVGSVVSAGASKLFGGKDKTKNFQGNIGQGSIDLAKQLAGLVPLVDPKAVQKAYSGVKVPKAALLDPTAAAAPFNLALTQLKQSGPVWSTMTAPSGTFNVNNRTGGVSAQLSAPVQRLLQQLKGARDQATTGLTGNIAELGKNIAGQRGLLAGLSPGFGQVTDARVDTIRNQGEKAASDLAQALSRRGVAGSSFGNAAESQRSAEFAEREANARAQSYLEELEAARVLYDDINKTVAQQTDTINKRYEVHQNAVTTELNQRNFATEIAADLSNKARASLDHARALQAELLGKRAEAVLTAKVGNTNILNDFKKMGYGTKLAGADLALKAQQGNQDAILKALLGGMGAGIDAGAIGAQQQRSAGQGAGFLGGQIGDAVGTGLGNWFKSPSNPFSWNTVTT